MGGSIEWRQAARASGIEKATSWLYPGGDGTDPHNGTPRVLLATRSSRKGTFRNCSVLGPPSEWEELSFYQAPTVSKSFLLNSFHVFLLFQPYFFFFQIVNHLKSFHRKACLLVMLSCQSSLIE